MHDYLPNFVYFPDYLQAGYVPGYYSFADRVADYYLQAEYVPGYYSFADCVADYYLQAEYVPGYYLFADRVVGYYLYSLLNFPGGFGFDCFDSWIGSFPLYSNVFPYPACFRNAPAVGWQVQLTYPG